MSGTSLRRKIVFLLLVAVLAASGAGAAELNRVTPGERGVQASLNLASQLWRWLMGLWNEEGCILDPNGPCITEGGEGSISTSEAGCILDPDGRCNS